MNNEIIIYKTPESKVTVEVTYINDTFWLTQKSIAHLFGVEVPAISKHLKNIFKSKELNETSVISKMETTANDGKNYLTSYYNLDAIIAVGYRVNSYNATQFRIWATKVLKDYLMKGYSINTRMNRIEDRVDEINQKVKEIDLHINSKLLPTQGIFYNGEIFDAYQFVSDLIRTAEKSIILIDNYANDTVLTLMSKRKEGVQVKIYMEKIKESFKLDIEKFNSQYEKIEVKIFKHSHDRFLIIDEKEVYHIGASLKDLGKKWFAFSKLEIPILELLEKM